MRRIWLYIRDAVGQVWDNEGTTKDGPGRCANTVIPRALPTNEESTDA